MIEEPTEGELYYNGQNFLENDHETKALRRQKIQIVFQNPYASLNPRKKNRHNFGRTLSHQYQSIGKRT